MKLNIDIALACLIGLILIQQSHCGDNATTSIQWSCVCYASYPGKQSSILESNCSRSCDCRPVNGTSADRWTCLCNTDGLPIVVAESHSPRCFTACDCTSGARIEGCSRKDVASRHIIILSLCIIATTFAVVFLLIFYVHQKGKFRNQRSQYLFDKHTSFSSCKNLISNKTSSVSESTINIGTPTRSVKGCFSWAAFIHGAVRRTLHATIIQFSYSELENATNKFSDTNIIGLGASSYVYRGELKDGRIVAIKKLKTKGRPDADSVFSTEIDLLSRLNHCHVVPLLGYCFEFQGRDLQRLLVFEYMSNGNLRDALDGDRGENMDWETRISIAIGAAKGLEYLHDAAAPRILHRDIKSTNILLDESWRAKITDLGMAKHLIADELASCTGSPVSMQGTFGYFAPEYAIVGRASQKSDVFSFGVVLLELITGRQPIHKSTSKGEESLVIWATPKLQDSRRVILELPDPRLKGEFPEEEMQVMAYLAKECLLLDPDARPTMSEVVQILLTVAPDKTRRNVPADIYQRRSSVHNTCENLHTERTYNQIEGLNDGESPTPAVPAGFLAHSLMPLNVNHSLEVTENRTEADIFSSEGIGRLIHLTSNSRRCGPPDAEIVDITEPWLESFCVANLKSS